MSIKVKRGGAYADVTGVFVKRGGAYAAAAGVSVRRDSVYGSALGSSSYLGQVATASLVPDDFENTGKFFNSRSPHFMRSGVIGVQIALPNWYVQDVSTVHTETGSGGVITFSASIEYPVGVYTQVKWYGSATIATENWGQDLSDVCSVAIPNGAQFWVNVYGVLGAGAVIPCNAPTALDSANGGVLEFSVTTINDKTMTGGAVNTGGNTRSFTPVLIVAQTSVPSAGILGDSRTRGTLETYNASGDRGELSRSIGQYYPYINLGRSGETAQEFINSHGRRLGLLSYVSHVPCAYGINDLSTATTANQLTGLMATIRGYVPTKPFYPVTLSPVTTGDFSTVAGQAIANTTNNTKRTTYNALVRAGLSGAAGYFDITLGTESSFESGKWFAPPAGTPDGLHANLAGSLRIVAQNLVNSSTFVPYAWGGGATESDVTFNNWVTRAAAIGGSYSGLTQRTYLAAIKAAKAQGVFSSLTHWNPVVGDAAGARVAIVYSQGASVNTVVGATYAEATGYTDGYIDIGYAPGATPGGLGVYLRTSQAADTTARILAGVRNSGFTQFYQISTNLADSGGAAAGIVRGTWGGVIDASHGNAQTTGGMVAGLWHVTRVSATLSKLYLNGVPVGTYTVNTTTGAAAQNIPIMGNRGSGAAGSLTAGSSTAGYFVDSGMNDAQALAWYNIIQAGNTAMARQV